MSSFLARLLAFLVRLLVPRIAYPILAGPLRGKRFLLGAAAGPAGGATIFAGRSEPEQLARVSRSVREGDVFFDVGANVGHYTLLAASLVGSKGRVVALEPLVRNLAYLHRHLEMNRVRNATVLPFACSDESGYRVFEEGETVATGRLSDAGAARPGVPVHVVTLDAVAALVGATPTVMKIDVEGAEVAVLRGARGIIERHRPRVFLSVHSEALREECVAFLEERGYRCDPLDAELAAATELDCTPRA